MKVKRKWKGFDSVKNGVRRGFGGRRKGRRLAYITVLSMILLGFTGCDLSDISEISVSVPGLDGSKAEDSGGQASGGGGQSGGGSGQSGGGGSNEQAAAKEGSSGGTPYVKPAFAESPFNAGAAQSGNGVQIDTSSVSKGYVVVAATSAKALKCKVTFDGNGMEYTYDVPGNGSPTVLPLQSGSGHYKVRVLENTTGTKYRPLLEVEADAALESDFSPFMRPNQFVNYSQGSACVAKANELSGKVSTEIEVVSSIYAYIRDNIKYDYPKAEQVVSGAITGYIPNPDSTLSSGTGICFDYASLAAAMLRSQGIPTQLITGYVQNGEVYHAWNLIYLKDGGKITVGIKAPKNSWQNIDLTFAATGGDSSFIGSGTDYVQEYVY